MNKSEALSKLRAFGSETCRTTYRRHGVEGEQFGVRYGDLGKLVKQIGTDHALAEQLWATGNHDARILATMIADPSAMKVTTLDAWAKAARNQPIASAVAGLAGKSRYARRCVEKWTQSKQEWISAIGWNVLAVICCQPQPADFTDDELTSFLKTIEDSIHKSDNWTRYCMNNVLISIGGRGGALQKQAIAAAKRIGKVEVDHGETSCKTPDAAAYIRKIAEHTAKKGTRSKRSHVC